MFQQQLRWNDVREDHITQSGTLITYLHISATLITLSLENRQLTLSGESLDVTLSEEITQPLFIFISASFKPSLYS